MVETTLVTANPGFKDQAISNMSVTDLCDVPDLSGGPLSGRARQHERRVELLVRLEKKKRTMGPSDLNYVDGVQFGVC